MKIIINWKRSDDPNEVNMVFEGMRNIRLIERIKMLHTIGSKGGEAFINVEEIRWLNITNDDTNEN